MNKLSKKILCISSIVSVIAGGIIGAISMHAAWEHNPSGEFHSEGIIHWANWCGIGVTWFVVVSFAVFIILGVFPIGVIALLSRLKKEKTKAL